MFKTPKGTIDLYGKKADCVEHIIDIIVETFKQFNGNYLNTPTFELREVLLKKKLNGNTYSSDEIETKLIYDLQDQGGEITSLKYDQTVPLVRHLIENNIKKTKYYQIGKVYRRDQPSTATGRYREFLQADFDIIGEYDKMESEVLIFKMINIIFKKLGITNYTIKFNFRDNLYKIFESLNIHKALFLTICTSLDKLDKIGKKK